MTSSCECVCERAINERTMAESARVPLATALGLELARASVRIRRRGERHECVCEILDLLILRAPERVGECR